MEMAPRWLGHRHRAFARLDMMPIQDGYERAMGGSADEAPGWADGLRKLYPAVIDEPVPAAFSELMARIARQSRRGS